MGTEKNSILLSVVLVSLTLLSACDHDHIPSPSTGGRDYVQVNLVSDIYGFGAMRVDSTIGNTIGMVVSPKDNFWITSNHTGRCVIFDGNGNVPYHPINAPLHGNPFGESPNGIVYNQTSSFLYNGKPALFICSTENGDIAGWNSGDSMVPMASRSAAGAIYKGIAIANDGSADYLYTTDFHNRRIDVFDGNMNLVQGKPFSDPTLPNGFAPFNIQNINGLLFVTYALQLPPDNSDDQPGPGNGFINIFDPSGKLVRRFASQGTLNSPWGITLAPDMFGQGNNAFLVANYGDGRINVFDSTGKYQGQLENNKIPITIDGLWDISFNNSDKSRIYFTAGPNDEAHALFGFLQVK